MVSIKKSINAGEDMKEKERFSLLLGTKVS